MRLHSVLVVVASAVCAFASTAAPVLPLPADVAALPSIELVLGRLGITATEYSTHLELDSPDVATPGTIEVTGRSGLPGTTRMLLFRGGLGAPAPVAAMPPAAPRRAQPVGSRSPSPPAPPPPPPPVLLASWVPQGDKAPMVKARYEVHARQWVTLMAQAQGRWFVVARDIKLGKAVATATGERSLP